LLATNQAAATSVVASIAAALEQQLTTLEASYVDRDTEFSNRFTELEALRVAHMTYDSDEREAALKKAMADLTAWRPDIGCS
jgi:spermidine/putrescine-binding protein